MIVPAASKAYKNWTHEGYLSLINYALKQNWQVILAGSPAPIEVELAQNLENSIKGDLCNLVGKSKLLEMLALIDQCDLVVAPDTGPTHMANAMNTPVIGYTHITILNAPVLINTKNMLFQPMKKLLRPKLVLQSKNSTGAQE
ncbi:lipopolysaccharide heptosyltransferase I [Vibrio ishigakensis]|uniref:Lipopolysaccharide heptosyltransferase I n=1 Tax=Vibrio ishigakensis TaxID=1481914 RepID=A0A0B8NQW8_9VIBR|nr:lipopolysaccharide heptosyltransferase I [Vibrio ishigakensis]